MYLEELTALVSEAFLASDEHSKVLSHFGRHRRLHLNHYASQSFSLHGQVEEIAWVRRWRQLEVNNKITILTPQEGAIANVCQTPTCIIG